MRVIENSKTEEYILLNERRFEGGLKHRKHLKPRSIDVITALDTRLGGETDPRGLKGHQVVGSVLALVVGFPRLG